MINDPRLGDAFLLLCGSFEFCVVHDVAVDEPTRDGD